MPDRYSAHLALLTKAIKQLGHTHINPESLTDLMKQVHREGWDSFTDIKGHELRAAHSSAMAGFRALFAPV